MTKQIKIKLCPPVAKYGRHTRQSYFKMFCCHKRFRMYSLSRVTMFKFIIFVYRLILFSFYFKYFFNFIRSFNPLKIISKNNINLIKNNYILIGSFLLLMANIIMHIGIFHLVEHRYFYPVMPWIEFLVYSKLINNNALKLVN